MPPKFQPSNSTSSNPSSQMMNPLGSKPSFSVDDVGKLTLPLNGQSTESSRGTALLHQAGSATSGSLRCLVGEGSFHQSPDGAEKSDHDSTLFLVAETDAHSHQPQQCSTRNFNPDMDPKKLKRLLANRVSAQKSRMKKLEYVEKLKQEIKTQEAKIAGLAPQVAFYEVQKEMLQEENQAMKQRMELLEKQKAEKDAEFKKLKHERDVLALTYFLQQEGI